MMMTQDKSGSPSLHFAQSLDVIHLVGILSTIPTYSSTGWSRVLYTRSLVPDEQLYRFRLCRFSVR